MMGIGLEDLRMLQDAEKLADDIWKQVNNWDSFARKTVGEQLVRAVDSIGANMAESFGRFHFGEKLQFLYYARGSVYESKYWLNRTLVRELVSPEPLNAYANNLEGIARQLNAFIYSIKGQRRGTSKNSFKERKVSYSAIDDSPLFSEDDIKWLQS